MMLKMMLEMQTYWIRNDVPRGPHEPREPREPRDPREPHDPRELKQKIPRWRMHSPRETWGRQEFSDPWGKSLAEVAWRKQGEKLGGQRPVFCGTYLRKTPEVVIAEAVGFNQPTRVRQVRISSSS